MVYVPRGGNGFAVYSYEYRPSISSRDTRAGFVDAELIARLTALREKAEVMERSSFYPDAASRGLYDAPCDLNSRKRKRNPRAREREKERERGKSRQQVRCID